MTARAVSPISSLFTATAPFDSRRATAGDTESLRSRPGTFVPAATDAQTVPWSNSRSTCRGDTRPDVAIAQNAPKVGKKEGPERALRPLSSCFADPVLAVFREEDLRWTLEEPCPREDRPRSACHL